MAWVVLDTYREVTDEGEDSDEPYSWAGGDTMYINGIHLTRDEFKKDYYSVETELEHGFVVAVAYTDGGTFGYSGYATILDVFPTAVEAQGLIDAAQDTSNKGEGWAAAYSFVYNGKTYHRDWEGYFAGLTSLQHYEF